MDKINKTMIGDICEEDTTIREIASKYLTEVEIIGDDYEGPTIICIVESLCKKIEEQYKSLALDEEELTILIGESRMSKIVDISGESIHNPLDPYNTPQNALAKAIINSQKGLEE